MVGPHSPALNARLCHTIHEKATGTEPAPRHISHIHTQEPAEDRTGLMMPLMSARMPKGRLGDLMSRKVVSQSCIAAPFIFPPHAGQEQAAQV